MTARLWDLAGTTALGVATLGGCVAIILRAARSGHLLPLPTQRIRSGFGEGGNCFIAFFLLYVSQAFAGVAGDQIARRLLISLGLLPLQLFLVDVWLRRVQGLPDPYGWLPGRRALDHIAAGILCTLVVGTLTLGIHMTVRSWVTPPGQEPTSDHFLIESALQNPLAYELWFLIALQAVVAAPLLEELLFRGFVQSWAVRHRFGGEYCLVLAVLAGWLFNKATGSLRDELLPALYAGLIGLCGLVMAPAATQLPAKIGGWARYLFPPLHANGMTAAQVCRGVFGSALLFAMFHTHSWPDPVPLTLLGMGLGWLAWRTQSLIGPVVCHALFNAMTLFQLRVIVLLRPETAG